MHDNSKRQIQYLELLTATAKQINLIRERFLNDLHHISNTLKTILYHIIFITEDILQNEGASIVLDEEQELKTLQKVTEYSVYPSKRRPRSKSF